MKKIQKMIWAMIMFVAVGGTLAFAMGDKGQVVSGTWRYKMTVTVETPEGLKIGSAVREVTALRSTRGANPETPVVRADVHGEAVAVDLGERGILFALIGGDNGYRVVFNAFPYSKAPMSEDGIHYYDTLNAGLKSTLPPGLWPQFVRFRDITDPKTVENLLEVAICRKMGPEGNCIEDETGAIRTPQRMNNSYIKEDRFAEAFGAGVKLQSVTIEMTDEPVTKGVDTWLPWLPDYYNKRLDGDRYWYSKAEYRTANDLASGDFSTGDKK